MDPSGLLNFLASIAESVSQLEHGGDDDDGGGGSLVSERFEARGLTFLGFRA